MVAGVTSWFGSKTFSVSGLWTVDSISVIAKLTSLAFECLSVLQFILQFKTFKILGIFFSKFKTLFIM